MTFDIKNKKGTGDRGEQIACEYLKNNGFGIRERNVRFSMGEIDIIALRRDTLHFVEVKTILCEKFPRDVGGEDVYDPSLNIHQEKIRKIARMGEWYVAKKDWEGDWQIDAVLVWIRKNDGESKVEYISQIV